MEIAVDQYDGAFENLRAGRHDLLEVSVGSEQLEDPVVPCVESVEDPLDCEIDLEEVGVTLQADDGAASGVAVELRRIPDADDGCSVFDRWPCGQVICGGKIEPIGLERWVALHIEDGTRQVQIAASVSEKLRVERVPQILENDACIEFHQSLLGDAMYSDLHSTIGFVAKGSLITRPLLCRD